MTTEQEVLDDLIQAITNTNTSNNDFLKVLKEGRDQDVALRDGTVVPSLTKRVVNAFSNSDYLMKADNLASVVDKQEARDNLNVPTKEEVAQATETEKGTAKIATTAIAQAGSNDTDFITAKKLRDALNASGSAPVSACRARVVFGANANILNSDNILSVTKNGAGDFTVKFINAMPDANYAVVATALGTARCIALHETSSNPTLKTTTEFRIWCFATGTGSAIDSNQINIGVFR